MLQYAAYLIVCTERVHMLNLSNIDRLQFEENCRLANLHPSDYEAFFDYLEKNHPRWKLMAHQSIVEFAKRWKINNRGYPSQQRAK